MNNLYKILLIEDDVKLQILVKDFLEKYGYQVEVLKDFKNIEKVIERMDWDLVLLDINLPYYDGFYLCRVIRKQSTVPIIIISARSGEVEQVMGIELGADDYITKPFSRDILLAKVKATLRRTYGEYINHKSELSIGELKLDEDSFKLIFRDRVIDMTKNEFKLLKFLFENRDKIVTREELLNELWDDFSFVDDNTLTVNVTRVKGKFEELGIKDIIKTKRGIGYYLDTNVLEGI